MNELIFVENLKIVGEGKNKIVYQHPHDNNKLIKVMRPELASEFGGFKNHGKIKQMAFQGIYRQFRREIINYIQLCKYHYKEKKLSFPGRDGLWICRYQCWTRSCCGKNHGPRWLWYNFERSCTS